ncbi:MAG: sigma-70 family RNA polymerase sigma factor [Oscillospiraceae bacterium]|nr:sigma-70 family RNA polymerase sigma factor [Oscillospiraceae bacterium]
MEDSKIIELYFARSEMAIPETAEKYGAYCIGIAKNILRNTEDSEECVNDTYLAAWNAIPPTVPQKLSAFLGKITRNISLGRFRKNRAEKRGKGEAEAVLEEIEDVVSGRENIEKNYEDREVIKAVNDFLAGLSEEARSIFICRYWYFDNVEDIAGRFGKKESGIYSSLERTRKKLKKYLSERGYDI